MASSIDDDKSRGFQDFPFDAMWRQAKHWIDKGVIVHQKFTCAGCGNRLTMDQPNIFFDEGTCDNCPATTDIRKQGCNFLIHMVLGIDASKQGAK